MITGRKLQEKLKSLSSGELRRPVVLSTLDTHGNDFNRRLAGVQLQGQGVILDGQYESCWCQINGHELLSALGHYPIENLKEAIRLRGEDTEQNFWYDELIEIDTQFFAEFNGLEVFPFGESSDENQTPILLLRSAK